VDLAPVEILDIINKFQIMENLIKELTDDDCLCFLGGGFWHDLGWNTRAFLNNWNYAMMTYGPKQLYWN
jgi:hypothetical protein